MSAAPATTIAATKYAAIERLIIWKSPNTKSREFYLTGRSELPVGQAISILSHWNDRRACTTCTIAIDMPTTRRRLIRRVVTTRRLPIRARRLRHWAATYLRICHEAAQGALEEHGRHWGRSQNQG
ncbi:hypothetical protein, partial [Stenotrophomonas sp. AR029]|uniref:hypothetical protein n=1 Tax=Stenotrophomonas sp. AR029 TaxID=3398601 RepID=UPI0039C6B73B